MYGELMSRIGKKPIIVPKGVKVEKKGLSIKATGSLGSLEMNCPPGVKLEINEAAGQILIENENPDSRHGKQLHGTTRALVANMIEGVSKGFEKELEIYGTGYNVKEQGGKLVLQVGFCHPTEMMIPKGIKVGIKTGATKGDDAPANFVLSGIDKRLLGQFAADIRKIKPPEPYKGKGIRYAREHIKRKVGKAFTSGTV